MINVGEKKEQILKFIEAEGPLLPVRIAKKIEMSPVFASAILSELLHEKKLKLSGMKIGSSPLYFIPGQEKMLENFSDYLRGVEKEAFLKLKREKIIKDSDEGPAIRVALRQLKDFAVPFKKDGFLFWRYAFEEEVEVPKQKERATEKAREGFKDEKVQKRDGAQEEPFLESVKKFVENSGLKFVEKIQSDKKEIVAKTVLQSPLGPIEFLLIAKNKKTVNKDEIKSALQRAEYEKMPCVILIRREPTKSIREIFEENKNLLKLIVMP